MKKKTLGNMKTMTFDDGLKWMKEHNGKTLRTTLGIEWYCGLCFGGYSEGEPEGNSLVFFSNGKVVTKSALEVLKENCENISFMLPLEPITFEDTVMFNDDGDCFIYVPKPFDGHDNVRVTIELIS